MMATSYFGNLKQISKDNIFVPVAICAKSPQWYTGLEYKKLAPTYEILKRYMKEKNEEWYTREYHKQILEKLDPYQVFREISDMMPDDNHIPCLICYEKPGDFCHRHLVAKWFQDARITCVEFGSGDLPIIKPEFTFSESHPTIAKTKKRYCSTSCEAMYLDD